MAGGWYAVIILPLHNNCVLHQYIYHLVAQLFQFS